MPDPFPVEGRGESRSLRSEIRDFAEGVSLETELLALKGWRGSRGPTAKLGDEMGR